MTVARRMRWLATGPVGLAVVFLALHVVLGAIDLLDAKHQPMGDVTGVYRVWMDGWRATGSLVGIDTAWVYPIGALPSIVIPYVLGGDAGYAFLWIVLVTVLDAVAFVPLAMRRPRLAWWWLAFTACLGPIALVRIDTIALPFVVLGVMAIATRPAVAAALFTLAAWIKVWPAALVVAMLVALRGRLRVLVAGAVASAVVVGVAVALGARGSVLSFVTAQTARSLQIEAPVAVPWLWSAASGSSSTSIYYDLDILTFQVRGPGVAQAAAAMNPLLVVGALLVCLLGLLARRRGADAGETLAFVSLGLVVAAIALNKVGSPQYFTWLVGPVLLGLLTAPARFRGVAVFSLVLAALTQLIYPWFYDGVLQLQPLMLAVLSLRNLLEVALLLWTLQALIRLPAAGHLIPAVARAHQEAAPRLVG